MKCKYCGVDIPNDSVFCPNCGCSVKMSTFRRILSKITLVKSMLVVITLGVWCLVFQNFGLFGEQKVTVTEGDVHVSGGWVRVTGINEIVAVDIRAINGEDEVFFNNPGRGEKDKYYLLPVTVQ